MKKIDLVNKEKLNKIRFFHLIKVKKNRITVQQISIASIMLALITVFKLIDTIFPKTPGGYAWVEFYMIFAIILVLIMPLSISMMVIFSAPFLWLAIGQTQQTGPLSFFLDYSLPLTSVFMVYLAKFIKEDDSKKIFTVRKIAILFLVICSFVLKWFFHTLSGVVAWDTPWGASASFNAPMVFATLGVTIFCVAIVTPKITFLQNFVNEKGLHW